MSWKDAVRLRKSETVFIFGSGASIKNISDQEWQHFASHDTFSFSEFFRQRKISIDYHMIAEIMDPHESSKIILENPFYSETTFFVQEGFPAYMGNLFIAKRLLPIKSKVVRFFRSSRGKYRPPNRLPFMGVTHGFNSLFSCINLALWMKWKQVVLVGVDLYDKRYFFVPDNTTRVGEAPGVTYSSEFPHAPDILRLMELWAPIIKSEGVALQIYNPQSLLARVLPLYPTKVL